VIREVEREVVVEAFKSYHEAGISIRSLAKRLGRPFSAVRDAVYRLETQGVLQVIRLGREYLVRLRDVGKALELGYIDFDFLIYHFGYITPVPARWRGHYISDEAYMTLPFSARSHEALNQVLKLELEARKGLEKWLADIGEWPRFSLVFYRVAAAPLEGLEEWYRDLYHRWFKQAGLEPLGKLPPAYGFFAFIVWAVRELTGADWREAFKKALELVEKYIKETQVERNKLEELVEEIVCGMRQSL
jgi:DNA-binding Lrp family transcriptional regulator